MDERQPVAPLGKLREFWETNSETYERFGEHVRGQIARTAATAGIRCEVTSRVKSLDSMRKKVVRKGYQDPIKEITDKVGVRVLLLYQEDAEATTAIIRGLYDVTEEQNKRATMGHNVFDYQGIHLQVRARSSDAERIAQFGSVECEVQIHTRIQNAWSESTHDIAYKTETKIAQPILRRLHRLVALCELFDNELSAAREEIFETNGFVEAQVLASLERNFSKFTDRAVDRQLSLQVVSTLIGLFEEPNPDRIVATIDNFVNSHRADLESVFDIYATVEDDNGLFLRQPECLLIFERLENHKHALQDAWCSQFPVEMLEKVALAWGTSLE